MTAPNGHQIDAVPHKGMLCEIWRLGDNHEDGKTPDKLCMKEGIPQCMRTSRQAQMPALMAARKTDLESLHIFLQSRAHKTLAN